MTYPFTAVLITIHIGFHLCEFTFSHPHCAQGGRSKLPSNGCHGCTLERNSSIADVARAWSSEIFLIWLLIAHSLVFGRRQTMRSPANNIDELFKNENSASFPVTAHLSKQVTTTILECHSANRALLV